MGSPPLAMRGFHWQAASPAPASIRAYLRVASSSSFSNFSDRNIPTSSGAYPRKHGQSFTPRQASLSAGGGARGRFEWPARGSRSHAHIQKYSIFPAIDPAWMRPSLPGTPETHPADCRADRCPVLSAVMAAIGPFERALIGEHIWSRLEREVRG